MINCEVALEVAGTPEVDFVAVGEVLYHWGIDMVDQKMLKPPRFQAGVSENVAVSFGLEF